MWEMKHGSLKGIQLFRLRLKALFLLPSAQHVLQNVTEMNGFTESSLRWNV